MNKMKKLKINYASIKYYYTSISIYRDFLISCDYISNKIAIILGNQVFNACMSTI